MTNEITTTKPRRARKPKAPKLTVYEYADAARKRAQLTFHSMALDHDVLHLTGRAGVDFETEEDFAATVYVESQICTRTAAGTLGLDLGGNYYPFRLLKAAYEAGFCPNCVGWEIGASLADSAFLTADSLVRFSEDNEDKPFREIQRRAYVGAEKVLDDESLWGATHAYRD